MTIEQIFVQAEGGIPSDEAFHKAWHGFTKRKLPCLLFTEAELTRGDLPISKSTLVVGGLRIVEQAMQQVGMKVPQANNLPEELQAYFGRKILRTTLESVRKIIRLSGSEPCSCFLKPLNTNKGFPGIALFDADDLVTLQALPDDYPVLLSEYVLFESEWRVFVCEGEIVGLSHYQGDCFRYPDSAVIRAAIRDFTAAPRGYGIDFGVLSSGKTVLIEANDGYSLGSYSLNSVDYSRLLEARWLELAA